MPWTDWAFASTANQRGTGAGWSGLDDSRADDDVFASVDVDTAASRYIVLSNYGFALPVGARIITVEIAAEIKAWNDTPSGTHTYYVGLHKDPAATPAYTTGQSGTYTVTESTEGAAAVESPSFRGMFGISLSNSEANDGSFGTWLYVAQGAGTLGNEHFGIDYLKARIAWTYPGSDMIGDI